MSDFDDYLFSLPQNWVKGMDFFKNFFSQVKIRYLRQLLFKFLQYLNGYSNGNGLLFHTTQPTSRSKNDLS